MSVDGAFVAVLVAAGAGYLVGSVSPATLLARARGVDLASSGSGNPGATNAGRVMGRGVGIAVGLLDVAKGFLPAYVALVVAGEGPALAAGAAAVLGHVTSPWLRGRGGRGVATSFGAVLAVAPLWALGTLVVFGVVFAFSRWMTLASMASAVALVGIALAAWVAGWPGGSPTRVWWALALAAVVLWRHRRNVVQRLRAGPRRSR